jgi:Uma2 family endonuclease
MNTNVRPLTIDDLHAMPLADGYHHELIEGKRFVYGSPGVTHERVLANVITLFVVFSRDNPTFEYKPMLPLVFSEHSAVIPDLAIFLNDQSETIINDDGFVPPALICEVVEEGLANTGRDCGTKLKLYSKHGVPEYWVVYPKTMTIDQWVKRGDSLIRLKTLGLNDTLTSEIVSGFSCLVSEIFSRIEK